FKAARDPAHVQLRLRDRDARLQSGDRAVVVPRARLRFGQQPGRVIDVRGRRIPGVWLEHAHDREYPIVELDRRPDCPRVTAELLLPERVRQYHGQRAAWLLLVTR